MEELRPPTTLSHYRIVSKLGAGGMDEAYLAEIRNQDPDFNFQKAASGRSTPNETLSPM